MQGDVTSDTGPALVVVVPRARLELCPALSRTLGDAAVQVILDRRVMDRRVRADGHGPDRRRRDRRLRADIDAELRAGRWVAVPRVRGRVDFLDPDARAILFLCCGQHVVPCQTCQNIYRLGWIPQADPGVFPCPRCGNDLTAAVVVHAQTCRYWANLGLGAERPPAWSGLS
jgi:predicted RNA-binding Zn-ribbon protein involved in translation (DUF1610 family)